ncbi:bifunctional folylpolyglutamate synthase/dihydrofolate synthase [Sphingopyxis sp. Root214]|uniref:bifunctional folylpolyglutamate synthase/dihydrofolate synthase n=1 Tax=unclassified Sphingopyxis TaxID=2614943 RepID=UPI0007001AFA|nr:MULTISPECIES: folylpolyglutamate synthase/dihydrofolate synthase family protein [unclassified Sphingopyxis]KQZ71940.1 bifunctional folylpolyglutamate synthase/dihydrofolate synthase [Sphingopyxis sp. Root154]KRC05848.1 bifunctional folylpolyglutamate synthase/dihydrofolate synthase [Sphingopyxis sp. Root214]
MPDHAHSSDPAVQTQLDRLAALSPGRDILGLERIAELCARLGNPQLQLPRTFHVAGTNGKGSTCAYLRAILEAQGRKVHSYTSPHLVRFNERIRLAGRLIDDELLAALLEEVLDEAADLQASFFEVTTAAAFLAFARIPADDCIIEVGLGGRLDATNIIPPPAVCGIASLGIDHEAFLLAAEAGTPDDPAMRIAWEKAGIIKPDTPVATFNYPPGVRDTIAAKVASVGATLFPEGNGWTIEAQGDSFRWTSKLGSVAEPMRPRMAGSHQMRNAGLAIAMLRLAPGPQPTDEAIARGVASAFWPGRMQRLGTGPLAALLPDGTEIWLDGAHNVDAGLALARQFADEPRRVHLITGMLSNKDPAAIIAPLADRLASLTAVPVPGHEHHGADSFGPEAKAAASVVDAMRRLDVDPTREIVLIAGSLYLAGEVLSANLQFPD